MSFILSLILSLHTWTMLALPQGAPTGQPVDACKVFGVVYEEKQPHLAMYRVYVEKNEYQADVVVFREPNRLMATQTGMWHFIKQRSQADFSICFVDDPGQAHFTVAFAEFDADARCNR